MKLGSCFVLFLQRLFLIGLLEPVCCCEQHLNYSNNRGHKSLAPSFWGIPGWKVWNPCLKWKYSISLACRMCVTENRFLTIIQILIDMLRFITVYPRGILSHVCHSAGVKPTCVIIVAQPFIATVAVQPLWILGGEHRVRHLFNKDVNGSFGNKMIVIQVDACMVA